MGAQPKLPFAKSEDDRSGEGEAARAIERRGSLYFGPCGLHPPARTLAGTGTSALSKWRITSIPDHVAGHSDMIDLAYSLFDVRGSGDFALC